MLFLFLVFLSGRQVIAQEFAIKEVSLRSVNTGKNFATVPVNIKPNPEAPGEYILEIGDKAGITGADGKQITLWFFKQKLNVKKFKPAGNAVEVSNIAVLAPFYSGKELTFDIPEYKEINDLFEFPFAATPFAGDKVKLTLCLYAASKTKKKTVIAEELQMLLEFSPAKAVENAAVAGGNNAASPAGAAGVIEEEKAAGLTPEELEAKVKAREDSLLQVKTAELDIFISTQNQELNAYLASVSSIEQGDKTAADSLAKLVNLINGRVNVKKEGNIAVISNNDELSEKFTVFNLQYNELIQKIEEQKIKIEPEPVNWMMYAVMGMGAFMLAMTLFMQIWTPIKIKRQQRKAAKEAAKAAQQGELSSININDLDQI
jgi:hypothetical protein